jgi:LacI family transcriptional regulator, galactose operon repressor
MSESFRIALLIDTSTSWGSRLITGINRFAHEVGNWLIHVEPRGRYDRFRIPQGWDGDGIIARINRKEMAEEIISAGIPAVNVSWYLLQADRVVQCTVDEHETGRMAAAYFLANGFQRYAYCGPLRQLSYPDRFADSFSEKLSREGHSCHVCPTSRYDQQTIAWDAHRARLVEWLQDLPKPIAILCWSAARGRQVTEACHYAKIRVPGDVAVLGGDHDELMSNISNPPLSTIDQPAEQIGHEAASLLNQMMHGQQPIQRLTLFPPTRICVRHSTDTLAIEDELVRNCLRLIRQQAHLGIHVGDVVAELAVARRALEQRFVRLIGHTPAAEIRRVRIEAAKRLLVETNRSMAEIAQQAGFGNQDQFSRNFRHGVGLSPSQFRRQHQK